MLEKFETEQQKEANKKLEMFKQTIKEKITDKNPEFKNIVSRSGDDSMPLHELIDSGLNDTGFVYEINGLYNVPKNIEKQIEEIYNSLFNPK